MRWNVWLVLVALLYGAETWQFTVANRKKLEVGHHRWQRKILAISWVDSYKLWSKKAYWTGVARISHQKKTTPLFGLCTKVGHRPSSSLGTGMHTTLVQE